MDNIDLILVCVAFYAVLFTQLYFFIRGASRCVYVSKEEWERHFNEVANA